MPSAVLLWEITSSVGMAHTIRITGLEKGWIGKV